ncbi:MAG: CehA/McbA family metallohydrolase [Bacillota bacterium]|nr:CehA/McbA family metallohydrolase [Bacillota bacterium]MDW7685206.1 CehA/McbA family metallohydrolase [Bacillota bacterium]
MYSCLGNIHIHSAYSDGTSSIPQIAKEAAEAGLHYIIITDHNTLTGLGEEGYYDNVLVLCGSEINMQKNHYLALNIKKEIPPNDDNPQQVIDAVNSQNGLGFIAHPYEKGSPLVLKGKTYPWTDWDATDFAGIEVWNWSSQWRDGAQNIPCGLYYAYLNPAGPITGPHPQAMARFDEITQTKKITAIAGSDAHNWPIRYGPVRRDIFPYGYLFRTACNNLLLQEPLSRDVSTAKSQIYNALRHGRSFIVNRLLGDADGFAFTATSKETEYHIGNDVPLNDMTVLNIQCPDKHSGNLSFRIFQNGSILDEINRCSVSVRVYEPGTYRLEVRQRSKPWIFTNPIYIH